MADLLITRVHFCSLVLIVVANVFRETGATLEGIQTIFSNIHLLQPTYPTYPPPDSYPNYVDRWGTGICNEECTCGVPNRMTRIIGGEATQVNEYPWVVALTKNNKIFCAGTLITDRHVLTAAHCVNGNFFMLRMTVAVVLGGHYASTVLSRSPHYIERRGIAKVATHPNFRPGRGENMDNDIAIIHLSYPVHFTQVLAPVCLPSPGETFAYKVGTVAGWGRQAEKGASATQLHAVKVPIMPQEDCYVHSAYDSTKVTENMMCAGHMTGGYDSCQGDSGSALVVTDHVNRSVAAGIVSWGEGCGRPYRPGVYTRVNHYLLWIQENNKDGCFCG